MLVGYIMLLVAVVALLPWGDDFPSVQIPSIIHFSLVKKVFYVYIIYEIVKQSNQATKIQRVRLSFKIRLHHLTQKSHQEDAL